jgi:hypothetical protein
LIPDRGKRILLFQNIQRISGNHPSLPELTVALFTEGKSLKRDANNDLHLE